MKPFSFHIIKIAILCIIAAALNYLLTTLCIYVFKIPLFVDTVFTAAVSFSAGLIPGLVTALLTYSTGFGVGAFTPFILCSITEVILICKLKPTLPDHFNQNYVSPGAGRKETALTAIVSIFTKLMVLYVVCCLVISILGGLIDYVFYTLLPNAKQHFSAEDTYKIGLLQSDIHVLPVNILSRIPVNLVDRFIVVFGGYFISRLIDKIIPPPKPKNEEKENV